MPEYVALLHKSPGSCHGVMFPDFPGCVSAGETVEDALRMGAEALALHMEGMRRDGEAVPEPRTLEEIRAAGEAWVIWEGAIAVLVEPKDGRAPEPLPPRPIRIRPSNRRP
ncbi:type II toxin-antitoxin system HicB family antitoxin [Azospirillum sp. SYSU D00513]|uniref:type II toxin-antitoxin system HicB family antitoxin n=1 Tax=Azospirillum sp. SYSU D00513 TaxID=2812561 RepID=UPI001A956F1E|nr:type II toxin-antitoxin system HicB family antitoxin [Azospirillum sp. SYSU D00513]